MPPAPPTERPAPTVTWPPAVRDSPTNKPMLPDAPKGALPVTISTPPVLCVEDVPVDSERAPDDAVGPPSLVAMNMSPLERPPFPLLTVISPPLVYVALPPMISMRPPMFPVSTESREAPPPILTSPPAAPYWTPLVSTPSPASRESDPACLMEAEASPACTSMSPPSLPTDEPALIVTPPTSPCEEPLEIEIEPDIVCAGPVVKLTLPLCPAMPEAAELMVTAPLSARVEAPLDMVTDPPVKSSASPAVREISPPGLPTDDPTRAWMPPAEPLPLVPVESINSPEWPSTAFPEPRKSEPVPLPWTESADFIITGPLDSVSDAPDETCTDPPAEPSAPT